MRSNKHSQRMRSRQAFTENANPGLERLIRQNRRQRNASRDIRHAFQTNAANSMHAPHGSAQNSDCKISDIHIEYFKRSPKTSTAAQSGRGIDVGQISLQQRTSCKCQTVGSSCIPWPCEARTAKPQATQRFQGDQMPFTTRHRLPTRQTEQHPEYLCAVDTAKPQPSQGSQWLYCLTGL